MAGSALLQKILTIDQLRAERRAGGIFDCDASGCYDRILPPLASVHLRALGIQQPIATFLARLMFLAKRYIRTTHGVSAQNIGTTKNQQLHGIGQGNGGVPAIWLSHLTIMFKALSSVNRGFHIECVDHRTQCNTVGTGYVDDVTLVLSVPKGKSQTTTMVRKLTRQMVQLWENLLFITGGRLEVSKCFWVPIVWDWKQGKPSIKKATTSSRNLSIVESETGTLIEIPRQRGADSNKRLGVISSCDATWAEEYKQLNQNALSFRDKVKQAKIGRVAGYHAYHSMWIAKIRYSVPVIGFSPRQMQILQQRVIGPCLSSAGYCKTMPRAVVFGPTKYGGMY